MAMSEPNPWRPGCWVNFAPFAFYCFQYHCSQFGSGAERSVFNDEVGNFATFGFFSILIDDIGQIVFIHVVDDIFGGDGLIRAEAHIQWGVMAEAEPSVFLLKLK